MNKVSPLLCLILILFLLLFSSPSIAAQKAGWPSFTLTGGGYSFDSSEDLDAGPLYGIKLGYEINGKRFSDRLGIEGVFSHVATQSKIDDDDVDAYLARIDLLYLFNRKKDFVPFLTVGAGGIYIDREFDSDSSFVAAYGVGTKYYLTDYLAIRAEARHQLVFDEEQLDDFEYTLGLTYVFGKERKAKPLPPVDSDGDGVFDRKDQCADTPADMKVDRKGCPIDPPDGDEDGVPDYLDSCPETPRSYSVDRKGCPPDKDGDGVPDELDKCPSNPVGFRVDENGCMDMNLD